MVMSESKAIKKKLMAATSMLLVACIMLISASYAWFTLSTAPEITGISTAVGANGNLEIALADKTTWDDPDSLVQTSVGNAENVEEKNITWGNLVDLADTQTHSYGLNSITLLPSRLAVTVGKDTAYGVSQSPLQTPTYGTDGRIEQITSTTSFGVFSTEESSTGKFLAIADNTHGVRGIGAASGMTDRQLSYRTAKIELANSTSTSKVLAKQSLEANGSALANIIVAKAIEDASNPATYTQTDVATVKSVLTALTSAYGELVDGWEASVLGQAASLAAQKGDSTNNVAALTDTDYLNFAKVFPTNEYTVDTAAKTLSVPGLENKTITMPITADLATYWTKLETIEADIAAAMTEIGELEKLGTEAVIKWAPSTDSITGVTTPGISTALNYIVNSDNVTINGYTKEQLRGNFGTLAGQVAGGSGLQVQMPSGSGVYSDVADFCGNYSASVTLKNLEYSGVKIDSMDATMTTASSVTTPYYVAAANVITAAGVPSGEGASNDVLTDMYGYAIDFYLRTNAASSNLLLQVDEAQRIYSDSQNEETQGAGSNMTFTSADANFTSNHVKNLMKSVRVVFMDGEGDILGVAVLDTDKATVENMTVKADLKLVDFSFKTVGTNGTDFAEIVIEDSDLTSAEFDFKATQKITDLPQNTAVKVSALVYLDGDKVENSDVANAVKSMTGKLNLQFTSDAKLVPMDDSSLKGVTKTETSNP